MIILLMIIFLILLFLGMDIFYSLAISSFIFLLLEGNGLHYVVIIPQRMIGSIQNYTLLAIPLFMLAGSVMNASGITERLISFAKVLVGHIKGGLSYVAVITNVIMSGVSGSALADASTTGTILIPAMKKEGYDSPYAAAVIGAGAIIGPIIPPSIIMVLYAVQAEVSIGRLFLGGIIPGLLMGVCAFLICYYTAFNRNYPSSATHATLSEIVKSFIDSFLALIMPLVIIGGLVFGFVTPTETAGLAFIYALFLGIFVYKKLKLEEFIKICFQTGLMASKIMIILASGGIFSYILAEKQAANYVINLLMPINNVTVILFLLVIFLLILGMFISPTALVLILTPLFLPLAKALGLNPVFFGVFVIMVLDLGALTPPVGFTLYLVSSISGDSVYKVARQIYPFIAIYIVLILIIMFFPKIITFLPTLLMG